MSRVCQFCGKHTTSGTKYSRRGRPKYRGGIGLKITGVSKRTFRPNLQRTRAVVNGTVKTVRVCAKCLKGGKIQKPSIA